MPSREPTAENPWTPEERDAVVERIRERHRLSDAEKLRWHSLYHATSGMLTPTNSRRCEFCRLEALGK